MRTQRQYSSPSHHPYYELQTSSRRPRMSIYVTHTSSPSTRAGTRRDSKLATRAFSTIPRIFFGTDRATSIAHHIPFTSPRLRRRPLPRRSRPRASPPATFRSTQSSVSAGRGGRHDESPLPNDPPRTGVNFPAKTREKARVRTTLTTDAGRRRRTSGRGSVVARHSSTRRDPGKRRRRRSRGFFCVCSARHVHARASTHRGTSTRHLRRGPRRARGDDDDGGGGTDSENARVDDVVEKTDDAGRGTRDVARRRYRRKHRLASCSSSSRYGRRPRRDDHHHDDESRRRDARSFLRRRVVEAS